MRIQENKGLFVQNQYNHTNTELNKTLEKLSSGYKINRAGDDAAGLSISEKMRGQIRGLEQAAENIQDGMSFIQTAEGGMAQIIDPNLARLRELAVQAANDTLTDADRRLIQQEVDEIINGIDDIANGTEFNTIKALRPPVTFTPPNPSGTVDLVLIFDDTGSMNTHQKKFADNINSLIDSIKAKGVNDINIGVMYYTDDKYEQSPLPNNKWTSNPSDVITAINEIAQGTSGVTENNMAAIEYATKNYRFREYADSNVTYKHMIIVTDEPGNDNGRMNEIKDLLNKEDITLHTVSNSSPGIQYVAQQTGGKQINLSGDWGSQLAGSIGEAIGDAAGFVDEKTDMAPLILQVGANEGQHIGFNLYDCRSHKIGIAGLMMDTQSSANMAISIIDKTVAKMSNYRSEYGALYNRLEHAYNNVTNATENLTAAESNLRDADIAKEVTKMHQDQVLLQSAQSMMAQVNQMSQGILQLLQ